MVRIYCAFLRCRIKFNIYVIYIYIYVVSGVLIGSGVYREPPGVGCSPRPAIWLPWPGSRGARAVPAPFIRRKAPGPGPPRLPSGGKKPHKAWEGGGFFLLLRDLGLG